MKRTEMNEAFRRELENLREHLAADIRAGRKVNARWDAERIAGAAGLARRLGLLDWDELEHLCGEARDAARRAGEPGAAPSGAYQAFCQRQNLGARADSFRPNGCNGNRAPARRKPGGEEDQGWDGDNA